MLTDLKSALCNKWLFLSALAAFCVLIRPCIELIMFDAGTRTQLDFLYYLAHAEAFSGFHPFAILFCTLPYAASFFDERRSGYLSFALLRVTRRRYIASKMLSVFCAGAAALALAYIAVALIGVALFPAATAESLSAYYLGTLWEPIIFGWGAGWVPVIKAGLMALFGGIWALPGLVCASIFSNRLALYVVPLVAFQSMWTLFSSRPWFPTEYMIARSSLIPSLPFVIGRQMLYLAPLIVLCALAMHWRCRNG